MSRSDAGHYRDVQEYPGRFSDIGGMDNMDADPRWGNRNWVLRGEYQDSMDKHNRWATDDGRQRYPGSTSDDDDADVDDAKGNPKTFKRVLVRFADRTSMQGIPYINTSKTWWAKSVWTVLMLGALAAMIFHLYYLGSIFGSFEKRTKITLGFNNLTFPTVTFCNVNPVKISQISIGDQALEEFVESIQPERLASSLKERRPFGSSSIQTTIQNQETGTTRQNQMNGSTSQQPGSSTPPPAGRKKRFVDDLEFNFTNIFKAVEDGRDSAKKAPRGQKSNLQEMRDEFDFLFTDNDRPKRIAMGHKLNDMLISCSFSGIVCNASKFVIHPTTTYGNCFTLADADFITYRSGPGDGLELLLYLETEEYIPLIASGFGAQIHVHAENTWPVPETQGMAVSAGMETHLALRMVSIERKGDPYGVCDDGVEFEKEYGIKYTRQTCQLLCIQERIMSDCGCYDDESYELVSNINEEVGNGSLPPCRNRINIQCMLDVEDQWETGVFTCQCENPCYETTYQIKSSSRSWPSDDYANLLVQFLCNRKNESECEKLEQTDPRKLTQNFMKLLIYYEDLNFEEMVEVADYEDVQFLSDIGGTVGLWIGLSLLSLAEVAQFFGELIHFLCCVRPRRQKARDRKQAEADANNQRRRDPYINRT